MISQIELCTMDIPSAFLTQTPSGYFSFPGHLNTLAPLLQTCPTSHLFTQQQEQACSVPTTPPPPPFPLTR